ncbi:salivary cystatin-L-like [Ixodes scapularis]|uniref:salivary cystatin-L-like n=1 Tax=Ixodes scapularis TaxID=6945 RepID=UPI001C382CD0|nr:salivary cystatin-L-like [Ixodes scapularis]
MHSPHHLLTCSLYESLQVENVCTAVVYTVQRQKIKRVVYYICEDPESELTAAPFGAWKTQARIDPKYESLAHYAVSTQVEGREYYDTVLGILEVKTQIVDGVIYMLKFTTTQSTCKIEAGVEYSKLNCHPRRSKVENVCTAVVYTVQRQKIKRVVYYICEDSDYVEVA